MSAKAQLGYLLLDLAWEKTLNSGDIQNPWPWMDAHPVAKVSFPSQDKSFVVLNSDSGQALAFGPGLIAGLEKDHGTIGIAAHKNTHFGHLDRLRIDDVITLDTQEGQKAFKVTEMQVMDSRVSGLPIWQTNGSRNLLLVTCYPFDQLSFNGPLRYVVRAEPIKIKRLLTTKSNPT